MRIQLIHEVNARADGDGHYIVKCPICKHEWPESPVVVSGSNRALAWTETRVAVACKECWTPIYALMPMVPVEIVEAL